MKTIKQILEKNNAYTFDLELELLRNLLSRVIEKMNWQEEFEDEIEHYPYQGVNFNIQEVGDLLSNFIGKDGTTVKIKCKDGMIQIERVNK